MKQMIFKFWALVMMNPGQEAKSQDEIIKNLFCGSPCCFIGGGVGLCISCEMVNYVKNVLILPQAFLQMNEIN